MKKVTIILLAIIVIIAAFILVWKQNKPTAKIIENYTNTTIITWAYTTPILNDSTIKWDVKKVWWWHYWKVAIQTWFAIIDNDKIIWWEIILDMNSISVDDIENTETNQSLVNHLKSEDFFNVQNYPTAIFKILEINENNIIGDLTIKDFTNTIEIPVNIQKTTNWQKITSNFSIDRTMRDIMYGSTNLASTLKDKAIDNLIILELDINI